MCFFRSRRDHRLRYQRPKKVSRKPQVPPKPPISLELRNQQAQSPLFGSWFPAELRIAIYEAVLGDLTRLTHIVPFSDGSERVGRRRCLDTGCEYPTWQHRCFDKWWIRRGNGARREVVVWSSDKLLSMLLSCHRIYSEALDILYSANHFSVKGAQGLLEMRSVVPDLQWDAIRYMNISTIFLMPLSDWPPEYPSLPPESRAKWPVACQAIQKMRGLRQLYVEINVHDAYDRTMSAKDTELFVSVLRPLNSITVPSFEVELNRVLPDTVLQQLGKTTFTTIVKQRPFNPTIFLI
ncbi:hypothetical protein P280DRAFT_473832 [Massarina eburnea CBS 473.64]|uniref:DUF7730 domain-containing protein n=1 Tax=Massarina eburnea CBS 473.64 TaxID=1395130 RepID=A0A6A6RJH8_9PLEO|nr:hypothetical protein P280DRAFT_473832 [Massarina eburnea CBS 473.64]